ncbi:hypothetical protein [Marinactinospora rubrisoli]|uniref:Transcriptional regulator Rv0078-like C-terminal domain-containing protein n=1 Tax=Marinactinospora rubrisoli TaxID=2715399 RepID=A0ABW2KIC2_9ACTN
MKCRRRARRSLEELHHGSPGLPRGRHPSDVKRIVLVAGPAVLGWNEWRAMAEAASARHLAEGPIILMDAGAIARRPVRPLTHLLSGAMNEAARYLAGTDDPEAPRHRGRPHPDSGGAPHRGNEVRRTPWPDAVAPGRVPISDGPRHSRGRNPPNVRRWYSSGGRSAGRQVRVT